MNLLRLRRAIVLIGICGTTIHAGTALCQQAATDPPDVSTAPALQEVMVTATRQAQPLSKVPISVSAFTAAKMQELHIKGIEDVQAYTPGLNVQASGYAGTNISIRGISSTVGSATTGVYIDDTPIQVRQVGYTSFNIYPNVFDLERIEVLRGPQGTLFGAGSEGGTVRFITPPPNLSQASVNSPARATRRGSHMVRRLSRTSSDSGQARGIGRPADISIGWTGVRAPREGTMSITAMTRLRSSPWA